MADAASSTPEPIYFHSEKDPLGELSNFFPLKTPLTYQGKTYTTSEHLYQARKYLYPGASKICVEFADEIRRASTPYKAKILANRRVIGSYEWQKELVRVAKRYSESGAQPMPDWEEEKVSVMKEVLESKFSRDARCREVLLSTRGRGLVERSATDGFWGNGKNGEGSNWLGKLLVELRERIIFTESIPFLCREKSVLFCDEELKDEEPKKKKTFSHGSTHRIESRKSKKKSKFGDS